MVSNKESLPFTIRPFSSSTQISLSILNICTALFLLNTVSNKESITFTIQPFFIYQIFHISKEKEGPLFIEITSDLFVCLFFPLVVLVSMSENHCTENLKKYNYFIWVVCSSSLDISEITGDIISSSFFFAIHMLYWIWIELNELTNFYWTQKRFWYENIVEI